MDLAWLLAVFAFFGGCDLAVRLLAHLRLED
jgi:hypothetical protein